MSYFLFRLDNVNKYVKYRLKKAVVLGSGVMGSGIACHLANVGMEVLMLDILPDNQNKLNYLVFSSKQCTTKCFKSKPAPFTIRILLLELKWKLRR